MIEVVSPFNYEFCDRIRTNFFKLSQMRLFLSIILLVSIAQVNATDVLKVGISNKHSEVFNTNGKVLIGTATKPFQCILDRTDYAYKLVSIPHARLQKELISGSIDIGMPLAKSESRDKFALFSNTVIEVKFYLIFDSKYQFTDLEKYPVATVRTGKNNSEFELKNYTLFEVTDWKSAIGMLKKTTSCFNQNAITNLPRVQKSTKGV